MVSTIPRFSRGKRLKDAQTGLTRQGLAKSAATSFESPLLRAVDTHNPFVCHSYKKNSGVEGTWRRKPSIKILTPPESVSVPLALRNQGEQRRGRASRRGSLPLPLFT